MSLYFYSFIYKYKGFIRLTRHPSFYLLFHSVALSPHALSFLILLIFPLYNFVICFNCFPSNCLLFFCHVLFFLLFQSVFLSLTSASLYASSYYFHPPHFSLLNSILQFTLCPALLSQYLFLSRSLSTGALPSFRNSLTSDLLKQGGLISAGA